MRIGAALAAAAIAALLSRPAFAEGAASSTDTAPQQQTLSQGELDALVVPIALYPDSLLAQVLMAPPICSRLYRRTALPRPMNP